MKKNKNENSQPYRKSRRRTDLVPMPYWDGQIMKKLRVLHLSYRILHLSYCTGTRIVSAPDTWKKKTKVAVVPTLQKNTQIATGLVTVFFVTSLLATVFVTVLWQFSQFATDLWQLFKLATGLWQLLTLTKSNIIL